MGGTAGVFVGLAVIVIVIALALFVLPSSTADGRPRRPARLPGGSFLTGSVGRDAGPRRARVQQRLQRAIQHIDDVDPHATQRRIGEALLQSSRPARVTEERP